MIESRVQGGTSRAIHYKINDDVCGFHPVLYATPNRDYLALATPLSMHKSCVCGVVVGIKFIEPPQRHLTSNTACLDSVAAQD